MNRFLLFFVKRLLYGVLVLIGVSIFAFLLIRLAPGNPAQLVLPDGATAEQILEKEIEMGLDKPLIFQYFNYMGGILRGDFGTSITYNIPNSELIFSRLPATAILAVAALAVGLLISIPLGILAGVKKGAYTDFFSMIFALLGQSMPQVLTGPLLILFFGVFLKVLPTQGYGSFKNLILPAITLGLPMAALITRMLRSEMIEVLSQDYTTAIEARGIKRFLVVFKYSLKNALLPVITVTGIQLGTMLAGAAVVEKIYGWPGIGSLVVAAISQRDYTLIQSIVLVTAFMYTFINIIVDVIYTFVDPRMDLN